MNRNRISVGTMANVADAIRLPQSVEYCCMNDWIPTGTVIRVSSRRKMLEIKNSLYENRKEKIATAAMPGAAKGKMICQKALKAEQPSTLAASSNSLRTLSK